MRIEPAAGGRAPFWGALEDLAPLGYVEEEFVLAGEARGRATPHDPESTRPFGTRVLVRRPVDTARANGTVLVEWLNVSGGHDIAVSWVCAQDLIVREGWSWVGVSAQPVAVEHLKAHDPERYGSLVHPGVPPGGMPEPQIPGMPAFVFGETFSDGVFSAVGRALRERADVLLGGAPATLLLADGQSQSSFRLTSYLGDHHRADRVYDGFLLHGGGGTALPIAGAPGPTALEDLDTPVFKLNSELEAPGYFSYRQPDSDWFRYWEVAGTGHTPAVTMAEMRALFARDLGRAMDWSTICELPLGVVSIEYAFRAALHHLDRWAAGGPPPPAADLIAMEPGDPATVVVDEHGNALGGVRLPHVEAPLGRHLAANRPEFLRLMPAFLRFDDETLAKLYPTVDDYVAAVDGACERAVGAGHLLPEDAATIRAQAPLELGR